MPQKIPDIPKVDKKTSYQKLKSIVEKLREEFIRSYLVDSTSVLVVDNPGKGRSPEVIPVQVNARDVLVIAPTDFINYPTTSTTEISTAVSWPDGTACAVDIGAQTPDIAFVGYRVLSGNLYLRWVSFYGSGNPLNGSPVTITAFL
jgi:hypothetical protein